MPRDPAIKTPLLLYGTGGNGFKTHFRQNAYTSVDDIPSNIKTQIANSVIQLDLYLTWFNPRGVISPAAYEYAASINPDCQLIDYANVENYASNIFRSYRHDQTGTGYFSTVPVGATGPASFFGDESWFVHYPTAALVANNRMQRKRNAAESDNLNCYYVGKAEFKTFFQEQAERAINNGSEGFWIDNHAFDDVIKEYFPVLDSAAKETAINPATGSAYTLQEQHQERADFATELMDYLKTKFGDPPMAPPKPGQPAKQIWIHGNNGNYMHDGGTPVGTEADNIITTYGAASTESPGFFTPKVEVPGSSLKFPGPTLHQQGLLVYRTDTFDDQVDQARDIVVTRGLNYVWRGKEMELSEGSWPTTGNGHSRAKFAYASCLLVGGHPSHGKVVWAPEGGWGTPNWGAFGVDIGVAAETGVSKNWDGKSWIYRRQFTKAVVLVNSSGTPQVVNPQISGTYQRMLDESRSDTSVSNDSGWLGLSNSMSGSIEVEPWSAEILVHAEIPGGGATNVAPSVNAGPDQIITLPTDTVNLDGTVSDDGLPNPPGSLTYLWEKVSGPGTVTFGNSALVDTTAQFSLAGTYVLRLTAGDNGIPATGEGLTASDTMQVEVRVASAVTTYANHPRILYRDTDKTELTTRSDTVASWKTFWDGAVLTRADELVLMSDDDFANEDQPALEMALLCTYGYIEETGIPGGGYKEAARDFALYIAGLANNLKPNIEQRILAMSWAYDILHDDLLQSERDTLAAEIILQIDRITIPPPDQLWGFNAREMAFYLSGALTVVDNPTHGSQSRLDAAIDWWFGNPMPGGRLESPRYYNANGRTIGGNWYGISYGLWPELIAMWYAEKGTDLTPFTDEATWADKVWEGLLWRHRGGTDKDFEALGDAVRSDKGFLHDLERQVLGILIEKYPTASNAQSGGMLKYLWNEKNAESPAASTARKFLDFILWDPNDLSAVNPKDATSAVPTSKLANPPGIYYYREEGRGSGDDPWDYTKDVVTMRIHARKWHFTNQDHLDAGSLMIRFKDDPILLSPSGLNDTGSAHQTQVYQRSWSQSLVPLIHDTGEAFEHLGNPIDNDGGQHFKTFAGETKPDTAFKLLNDGGGEAWLATRTFEKLKDDSNQVFLRADIRPAYRKEHTDPERLQTCEVRYLIIKPSAGNGLTYPAILYYARVRKVNPSSVVTIPFHAPTSFTTTAYGWHSEGAGAVGKLWVDLRDISSYTVTRVQQGTVDANGYGDTQFQLPEGGANYKPSKTTAARQASTLKKESIFVKSLTPTEEEHFVCLLMPTAQADSEPVASRAWVTDVAQPNFYGITLGSEEHYIHRTEPLAVFGSPDTTPPGEVASFTLTARDKAILAEWLDPADGDLLEIRLYKRTSAT